MSAKTQSPETVKFAFRVPLELATRFNVIAAQTNRKRNELMCDLLKSLDPDAAAKNRPSRKNANPA